jgi:multimeric flavodoxin WrbA
MASMKKVTAFVASGRNRHTHAAAEQFLRDLQQYSEFETEIVRLSDYDVQICKGCQVCFRRGEEYCPLKDDRDALIGKMIASDGVVFATPNYSFQVSALMKAFLDRLGFAFHRPRFFGKTFTSIVVQGIYGGGKIVDYLDFVGGGLGFNTVKGSCLQTIDPLTPKQQQRNERILAGQARRFAGRLARPAYPTPSLLMLMIFRMGRTKIKLELDDRSRDYTYYAERDWFSSDYYYPARLGALLQGAGMLFDRVSASMTKSR